MGRKEIEALMLALQNQLDNWKDNVILGTWTIIYSKDYNGFLFEKCELGGYCEERPSIISVDGSVMDKGGPLLRV